MTTENPTAQHQIFDNIFELVRWPWVQDLMEYDWFRSEAILYQAFEEQEYLDSAYFVPAYRMREIRGENGILP